MVKISRHTQKQQWIWNVINLLYFFFVRFTTHAFSEIGYENVTFFNIQTLDQQQTYYKWKIQYYKVNKMT